MKTLTHWTDGKPVESASGRFGPVHHPATGAQDGSVGHHFFGGWKASFCGSFGGSKASFRGDLHVYGDDGIACCTHGKVITTRRPDPADAGSNLGLPSHS
jgi:hypothetical protein